MSVLFVDLVDFTSLAESMDPEEVRAVQARYFEVARLIVATHGGTLEKFIGDAVMAVWGAPAAHEDDAERAVRAALAIVHSVDRIGGAAAGRALRAHGAVATGEAAVTVGAVNQGLVAGDLVNIAARLQGRAPAGAVVADRATREATSETVTFARIGSLSLKGRTARLEAFRATGLRQVATVQGASHAGRLVGRDRVMREITDLMQGVIEDGRGRLVTVTGIAGIGKSRLAWELDRWVDAHPDDIAWHEGRALAYGEGVAFSAVAQMVRRRARIDEAAPPELARRQLASALTELVRDEGERRWIEPRLAALLSQDIADGYDRDELFAAWRRFFERVSELTPVVMIFEDLQWADPGLLDFVEYLATWSRTRRIFLLALARPELLDARPTWGAGVGSFTAITLERLPDVAMRELLADRAMDLDPRLVDPILHSAGGVPLYAVEVARMLMDRAAPSRRRTARAVTTPKGEVPDSLHGVIAARLDAIPEEERRLLMAASVLGNRFRPEVLDAVVGGGGSARRDLINGLVRREMLTLDDDLGSPGRGQLSFVQDLVREVAYLTLARTERRALHLEAARHFESADVDSPEALAAHLVAAHRLTPQPRDAARIGHRAVGALRRAARGAMAIHVPSRALELLENALGLADDTVRPTVLADTADAARRPATWTAPRRCFASWLHSRQTPAMRVERHAPAPVWPASSLRHRRTSRRSRSWRRPSAPSVAGSATRPASSSSRSSPGRARCSAMTPMHCAGRTVPCPRRGAWTFAPWRRNCGSPGQPPSWRSASRSRAWRTCERRSGRPRTARCCGRSSGQGTTWPGDCSATIRSRRARPLARDWDWPSRWASATFSCPWPTWPVRQRSRQATGTGPLRRSTSCPTRAATAPTGSC